MAGVSTPAMAAAVSNAGGLGALGLGAMDATTAAREIAAFRERSTRALHVNVFCHRPAVADAAREARWLDRLRPEFTRVDAHAPASLSEIYTSFVVDEAMFALLCETRPQVVSFHFGLPRIEWVRALREEGIVLFASATSLDEARACVAAGVHGVIAQGWEAGGHRGVFDPGARDDCLGTNALTRMLVRALDAPIIAAGGLMDGAGIASALRLGASAAQLGTAFVACDESAADAGYRAALQSDAAQHTTMTRAISGRLARCLANRFTALDVDARDIPDYPIAYDAGKALHAAAKSKGDYGYGAQWAGQGAPLSRAVSTEALMRTLIDELDAAT